MMDAAAALKRAVNNAAGRGVRSAIEPKHPSFVELTVARGGEDAEPCDGEAPMAETRDDAFWSTHECTKRKMTKAFTSELDQIRAVCSAVPHSVTIVVHTSTNNRDPLSGRARFVFASIIVREELCTAVLLDGDRVLDSEYWPCASSKLRAFVCSVDEDPLIGSVTSVQFALCMRRGTLPAIAECAFALDPKGVNHLDATSQPALVAVGDGRSTTRGGATDRDHVLEVGLALHALRYVAAKSAGDFELSRAGRLAEAVYTDAVYHPVNTLRMITVKGVRLGLNIAEVVAQAGQYNHRGQYCVTAGQYGLVNIIPDLQRLSLWKLIAALCDDVTRGMRQFTDALLTKHAGTELAALVGMVVESINIVADRHDVMML